MKILPWAGDSIFHALCNTLLAWRKSAPDVRDLPWRDEPTPYHVWISEIMLQQTRAAVVRAYYLRFLDALPSVRDLAAVDDDALMKLWQGLGYYSRARNLKRAAQVIVAEHGGDLPNDFDALLALRHRTLYGERNFLIRLRRAAPRSRRQLPACRRTRHGESHRHCKGHIKART